LGARREELTSFHLLVGGKHEISELTKGTRTLKEGTSGHEGSKKSIPRDEIAWGKKNNRRRRETRKIITSKGGQTKPFSKYLLRKGLVSWD